MMVDQIKKEPAGALGVEVLIEVEARDIYVVASAESQHVIGCVVAGDAYVLLYVGVQIIVVAFVTTYVYGELYQVVEQFGVHAEVYPGYQCVNFT